MKNKLYLQLLIVIFSFQCAIARGDFKSSFADHISNSKAEKIKSGFNNGNMSLHAPAFSENKGQVTGYDGLPRPEVKFILQEGNTKIFLLEKGIAYQFTKVHYPAGYKELLARQTEDTDITAMAALQKQVRTETFRMDMTLAGANANARITSEGKSADYVHYYTHDVLNVHQYNRITYHEIYPGIDWVIYTKNGKVKYDFVVRPGTDPSLIKMQFEHQEQISLNPDGSFTIKNSMGSITEEKPVSFQAQKTIETQFRLSGNLLSFQLSAYDPRQTLVIDPAVVWATYYGGTGYDLGYCCATDAFGNIYLGGYTNSTSGIASAGHQNTPGGGNDAFLVKFSSSGILQWATYYGGISHEEANFCATDALGNIYLTGRTTSTAGIASNGHQNTFGGNTDAFLIKFNSSGLRQWGTYYGGTGYDQAFCCTADASGSIYMAGRSSSPANIASGGHQNNISGTGDAFLVKFDHNGIRQWATYYGGTSDDQGVACTTDAAGNVYMAGFSYSSSNIASAGHQNTSGGNNDAFLVKFNSNGIRIWATYYGGASNDYAGSCATDAAGNVYLTGVTQSSAGIASIGHQNFLGGGLDAFLVKFNSNGVRQWATYYGGAGADGGSSCATDVTGNIYLAGTTSSSAGIASGGHQNTFAGLQDAYLVKFNSIGVRQWGSYHGSQLNDHGRSCATDGSGNIFIAGYTNSLEMASGGHQSIYGGGTDAFLVKLCVFPPAQPSGVMGDTLICVGTTTSYSVLPDPSAINYSWSLPSGWSGSSTLGSITIVAGATGVLTVAANNACGVSLTQTINITAHALPTVVVNSGTICIGETFTINPSGAAGYAISGGTPVVSPIVNTSFSITGASSAGCLSSNTAVAHVVVENCTSLYDRPLVKNNIQVLPNPNTGSFKIRSEAPATIFIYNEIGQCIFESKDETLLELNRLAKGIYLAHIVSGADRTVKKIVVLSD